MNNVIKTKNPCGEIPLPFGSRMGRALNFDISNWEIEAILTKIKTGIINAGKEFYGEEKIKVPTRMEKGYISISKTSSKTLFEVASNPLSHYQKAMLARLEKYKVGYIKGY